jgi:hypothetical protein
LEHLGVREVVGEIVNTVDGISLSLNGGLSNWSISERGSPMMSWFWGIIVVIVTSKFSILGVVDIINVRSINIFFDLV